MKKSLYTLLIGTILLFTILTLSSSSAKLSPALTSKKIGYQIPAKKIKQLIKESTTPIYTINLSQFNINNQKQNPIETTQGINNALIWAKSNGYQAAYLPAGNYLISKDSNINMVGDFTFYMDDNTYLYKESNGYQGYVTLKISYPNNNVTIIGGHLVGDKDTHDYSSGGPHEGGAGIIVAGSKNVTIQNVETSNFTGDGLSTGGVFRFIQWFNQNNFENGTLDNNGNPTQDNSYIRTKNFIDITNPFIKEKGAFSLELQENMNVIFYDTYFYDDNNHFISKVTNTRYKYQDTPVPVNATKAKLVFKQSNLITRLGLYAHVTGENITLNNCFSHDNRRQGLTIGGASYNVLVQNCTFQDMKGTAPQSGIDIEGENMGISKINIQNNLFKHNGRNIVVADGAWIQIHDNVLDGTTYAANLTIWERSYIVDTFNNTLIDSGVYLRGSTTTMKNTVIKAINASNIDNIIFDQGVRLDNVTFYNAGIRIFSNDNSATPTLGALISNTTLTLDNNYQSSAPLQVMGKIIATNLTINGHGNLGSIIMPNGTNPDDSTFTNMKVLNMDSEYGAILGKGTYKDCTFEVTPTNQIGVSGLTISTGTILKNTTFKLSSPFRIQNRNASTDDTIIDNCRFTFLANTSSVGLNSPFNIQSAGGNVIVKNSTINYNPTIISRPLIIIGDPFYGKGDNALSKVSFINNIINSSAKNAVGIQVYKGNKNPFIHEFIKNTFYNSILKASTSDIQQSNKFSTK